MSIRLDIAWDAPALPEAEEALRRAGEECVRAEGIDDIPVYAQVRMTDDDTIHEIKREYRGVDRPTNVLSFAALDDEDEPIVDPMLLGDIVVAFETTEREAAEQNKSPEEHFFHLIVHGVLHLIGYDHVEDADAEVMEALETKIMIENGMDDPYEN